MNLQYPFYNYSYTKNYVNLLKDLEWDTSLPSYHTSLLPNEKLDKTFFSSVKFINILAITGYKLYKNLQGQNKEFMNYFMGINSISENFIWKQRGLMQSYYKEGIPWQSGKIIDLQLPNDYYIPILVSAASDCVVALISIYIKNPNLLMYLVAEQQNYISINLFTKNWSYPVNTPSNPVTFYTLPYNSAPNTVRPHRLIFNWFSMGLDIINWQRTKEKTQFNNYIEIGKGIWEEVENNLDIFKQLLKKAESNLSSTLSQLFIPLNPSIFKIEISNQLISIANGGNINNFMNSIKNFSLFSTLPQFNNKDPFDVYNNIIQILKEAILNKDKPVLYKQLMESTATIISEYYCGKDCANKDNCPFLDPKVICVKYT